MKSPVFVYGTLSHPSVVQVLLGRPILTQEFRKAWVAGFSRHPVKNYVYPGMIPSTTTTSTTITPKVSGFLLEDLSDLDRQLLDYFEGDQYSRQTIQAVVQADTRSDKKKGQETITVESYIWEPALIDELELDQEWSYETFLTDKLEWYLENIVWPCRQQMEELGMTQDL
jgi:gamma-glutamylcyclotransferase (GGCT)/AIG2-like uncharacterized protein YtfP